MFEFSATDDCTSPRGRTGQGRFRCPQGGGLKLRRVTAGRTFFKRTLLAGPIPLEAPLTTSPCLRARLGVRESARRWHELRQRRESRRRPIEAVVSKLLVTATEEVGLIEANSSLLLSLSDPGFAERRPPAAALLTPGPAASDDSQICWSRSRTPSDEQSFGTVLV